MRIRRSESPAERDAAALRHAAWIARCVGRSSSSLLGPDDLGALARDLITVDLPRGSVVFGAGDPPSAVWIVRTGALALYAGHAPDRLLLSVLRPGDQDGDLAVLLGMGPPYGAEAMEDTTCLRLDAATFANLLEAHPAVARRWHASIATRLAHSQQRLIDLLGAPLPQQIARILLDEADGDSFPYSQATIAALLGSRRPSVNKVLKDLQRRGVLDIGYRSLTINDREALLAAARGTGGR